MAARGGKWRFGLLPLACLWLGVNAFETSRIEADLARRAHAAVRASGGVARVAGRDVTLTGELEDERARMAALAGGVAVVGDPEMLPFAPGSFDLVVASCGLHWVNDLPGALAQIRQSLRPGGLFLAALLGGATLYELRDCLMEAEINVTGGVSPRLAPTIELQTASRLLLRAGFHLPVADQERVIMEYADTKSLLLDLRGMGETNAHAQRPKHFTRRRILRGAARLYEARYSGGEGGIKATFDMLFLHGWKNDRPQQGAISSGTHN